MMSRIRPVAPLGEIVAVGALAVVVPNLAPILRTCLFNPCLWEKQLEHITILKHVGNFSLNLSGYVSVFPANF
jgi:hypothetical protein